MASIPGHSGLSSAEAATRLQQHGPNTLPGGARRTWRHIALDAAREPMFLLLVGGGVLYLILGDLLEGVFLFAMVLVTIETARSARATCRPAASPTPASARTISSWRRRRPIRWRS